ncbi:O-methyltransferase [Flavobacterium branchiophilum]|uniref:Methyltransferase n=1 Tax=Flavobacterium branchiophilum TaxID=55197 RepID=A0A2H3L1D2_9FLAO|nr:O-methyltransferase [Flavobacterium branchiophilum]PDS26575.1 methyltransferase [Flavobacterium branchiophilum]
MHFLSEAIEEYIEQHTENEPGLLAELQKETYQKILLPRMLSGHFQGRILSLISNLVAPKNILEIGTFTGYSALCLCEGMQANGQLHTIDIKEELVDFQRKYFDKSPWGNQIIQHLGPALSIIPTLDVTFDLVFIDADKENYIQYYQLIVPKMNKGGIILSDNVLWSGKVVEPLQKNDKSTKILLEYNALIKNDPRVTTYLLPIRDGLMLTKII